MSQLYVENLHGNGDDIEVEISPEKQDIGIVSKFKSLLMRAEERNITAEDLNNQLLSLTEEWGVELKKMSQSLTRVVDYNSNLGEETKKYKEANRYLERGVEQNKIDQIAESIDGIIAKLWNIYGTWMSETNTK